VVVDSLKALDPKRPIREADISQQLPNNAIYEYTPEMMAEALIGSSRVWAAFPTSSKREPCAGADRSERATGNG
jgi:hypothetical protein